LSLTIPLSKDEIHLSLCDYDEVKDEKMHNVYRTLLSDQEKDQESRFYFEKDRRRYLLTRALVRTVLSRYEPVPPEEWVFSANAYGRPEIANTGVSDVGPCFNISHTDSLIVLGVTKSRALGLDVENVRARKVSIDIAGQFLSRTEIAALAVLPPSRQQDRFFEYWTFKEAYIKARGMGLSIPLDKFSVQCPGDGAVQIVIDPELADDPERWQFWQFWPTPEYLVAVCAERVEIGFPALVVKKTIPMGLEKSIVPVFTRTSGNTRV
jgi:4'-phosphopantetheinyl transferase